MRYRVHVIDLHMPDRQYYHGYHTSNGNEGIALSKENAEQQAEFISANPRYLATVEEYEIPPANEENHHA